MQRGTGVGQWVPTEGPAFPTPSTICWCQIPLRAPSWESWVSSVWGQLLGPLTWRLAKAKAIWFAHFTFLPGAGILG